MPQIDDGSDRRRRGNEADFASFPILPGCRAAYDLPLLSYWGSYRISYFRQNV
jgi:hypothetical protein